MSKKTTAVDKDLIRDLAAILNDTDLTEIEVEQNELRIRVSRQGTPAPVQVSATSAPAPVLAPSSPEAPVTAAVSGTKVNSPMVGTSYLSPAPGAAEYVKIGDKVKQGQTILIIEAMKTMNQIPAPVSGTVVAINVEDQQPVEYGEHLMTIE